METKYTKGEWKLNNDFAKNLKDDVLWFGIKSKNGKTIAEVKGKHYGIKNSEAEANAKLIAAVPKMHKCLWGIVTNSDLDVDSEGRVVIRISKNQWNEIVETNQKATE